MAEKKTSQTQQNGRDAFAAGMDLFSKMLHENMERVNALWDELADMESKAYDRAKEAVDEAAKLQNELLKYQGEIAKETRRLFLETTRKTADLWAQA